MASAQIEQDPEDIADDISDLQREIIQEFADFDSRNTKQLREATEASNGKVNYHVKRSPNSLVDRGLIEFVGYDEDAVTPGDGQPSEYVITRIGRDVLEVFRQREAQTEADISRVDELAETVERLDSENDTLRERLAEAEDQLEKHRKAIKYIQEETGIE